MSKVETINYSKTVYDTTPVTGKTGQTVPIETSIINTDLNSKEAESEQLSLIDKLKKISENDNLKTIEEALEGFNINIIKSPFGSIQIQLDEPDLYGDVSDEDKKSIDTLIEGEKELDKIKDNLKESLKQTGYTDEEIEEMLPSIKDTYAKEHPEYAKAKEKFGNLQKDYDDYINGKMEEWTENNPIPDHNATKKEWDAYYEKREEYESALNTLYKLENPEYEYYEYKKSKNDTFNPNVPEDNSPFNKPIDYNQ